jgi:hypothetical protein
MLQESPLELIGLGILLHRYPAIGARGHPGCSWALHPRLLKRSRRSPSISTVSVPGFGWDTRTTASSVASPKQADICSIWTEHIHQVGRQPAQNINGEVEAVRRSDRDGVTAFGRLVCWPGLTRASVSHEVTMEDSNG